MDPKKLGELEDESETEFEAFIQHNNSKTLIMLSVKCTRSMTSDDFVAACEAFFAGIKRNKESIFDEGMGIPENEKH